MDKCKNCGENSVICLAGIIYKCSNCGQDNLDNSLEIFGYNVEEVIEQ